MGGRIGYSATDRFYHFAVGLDRTATSALIDNAIQMLLTAGCFLSDSPLNFTTFQHSPAKRAGRCRALIAHGVG